MLLNAAPEKEEIDLYMTSSAYDISTLAIPDLFFIEIRSVP